MTCKYLLRKYFVIIGDVLLMKHPVLLYTPEIAVGKMLNFDRLVGVPSA
jgi:hypothetical protein